VASRRDTTGKSGKVRAPKGDNAVSPGLTATMSPPQPAALISAQEAVRRLGVKPATLYAYVSRGLLRSTGQAGVTRATLLCAGRGTVETAPRESSTAAPPNRIFRCANADHGLRHLPVRKRTIVLPRC